MITTLREIKSFNPCVSGWKKLCRTLRTTNLDTEVSILQILESNGVQDAFWALKTQDYKDYCLILADIAESVLHIFEDKYPNNNIPRSTIQAIRDYKEGKITIEELEIHSSAADAAADAAAYATAYAADAAAAYAATAYAATAAAYAAAYADAADAGDAADAADAAADEGIRKQWDINEKILRKHLGV